MAAKRVAVRFKTQRPGAGPGDAGPCRGRRQRSLARGGRVAFRGCCSGAAGGASWGSGRGGAGAQVCETPVDWHERSKVSELLRGSLRLGLGLVAAVLPKQLGMLKHWPTGDAQEVDGDLVVLLELAPPRKYIRLALLPRAPCTALEVG